MKMTVGAMVALLMLTGPAGAQSRAQVERRYSAEYDRCLNTGDAAQGVTSAMMSCTGLEIDRQDARLNQAYRMVMQRLRPNGKARLRTSERAWIARRDRGCRRSTDAIGGGSAAGLNYSGCILHETVKRTMWLENYRG